MWYIVVDCERMLRVKEREREGEWSGERKRERMEGREREQFFVTFY